MLLERREYAFQENWGYNNNFLMLFVKNSTIVYFYVVDETSEGRGIVKIDEDNITGATKIDNTYRFTGESGFLLQAGEYCYGV